MNYIVLYGVIYFDIEALSRAYKLDFVVVLDEYEMICPSFVLK